METYLDKLKDIKKNILEYTNIIFRVYGNELILRLEDYNLLFDENNSIQSSTAIGFVIEEFIISKLITYTQNYEEEGLKIKRHNNHTIDSSYDCYSEFSDIYCMINIKVQKKGKNNNAISSINKLYNDYVVALKEKEKAFLILKIHYDIKKSKDNQNKIHINDIESFFLEEIDFSKGHKQDKRNWSAGETNLNSGRLNISKKYLDNNLTEEHNISHSRTKQQIRDIFDKNTKK